MEPGVDIKEAAARLKSAASVCVLTGAGISAESGVPTFRGEDGLWKSYRAEELATPEAFERDPVLVWQWYNWRRELLRPLEPNAAHRALSELEGCCKDFSLVTQNVDGLHELAGSRHIFELHGNIWRTRCTGCATVSTRREDLSDEAGGLPRCECGALLRPDIVWFGESLEPRVITGAVEAAKRADFFFVVGTSSVVQPAASLSVMAKEAGAYVVEINPEATAVTGLVDLAIKSKATLALPQFL